MGLAVLDRTRMEVIADELRIRERLRHDHGGPAVAAADIGNPGAALQFFDHAIERGQPMIDQVRFIAGTEETRGGAKQTGALVAPAHASAMPEGRFYLLLIADQGDCQSRTRRSC